MSLATSGGRPLQLGPLLGQGGEGAIYQVADDPGMAVKLYTDGRQAERLPKLRAMIADGLVQRAPFVAFPLDIVAHDGRFAGFVMRKALAARPIFDLCITSNRKSEFPAASYRFLVRVALNYARAVAACHSLGAVIGDINESGALVSRQGLVTLIDSDSFQYTSDGRVHRCRVGKPEFTPPELQGCSLADIDRTTQHDAFGLAVILFELLFLGRHPFQGIPRGRDAPTIAEAIAAGRFAYSPHKALTRMDPPRHMPVLADMPVEVAQAFQRAFGPHPGGARPPRPTAAEWAGLLATMEDTIVECNVNPAHHYSRNAGGCPWCRFEAGCPLVLFIARVPASRGTFDIEIFVARIRHIASPGRAPDLAGCMAHLPMPGPSPEVRQVKHRSRMKKGGAVALALLAVTLLFTGNAWGLLLLLPAGLAWTASYATPGDLETRLAAAQRDWQAAEDTWAQSTGTARFDAKRAELDRLVAEGRGFPALERKLLGELEGHKKKLQMRTHLESCKLASALIDGIGEGRRLTLRSFGIETAWDIERNAVQAIPGFGEGLTGRLLSWRRQVEAAFRFDPTVPTEPAAVARVQGELALRRSALQRKLLHGINELETIRRQILDRRDPQPHESAYRALQQAQVDQRYLG